MYVFGGDKSDVGSIYIYDFKGDSWSKQVTSGAPAALSNSRSSAVLDHDTNVLFTVPGGGQSMYSAGLGSITNVASGTVAWEEVGTPQINTEGATTAALSNNHITFFGVPNVPAGSAGMFVVHTSSWQKDPATFTALNGGSNFPDQSGQAVSFFLASAKWQQSMLFVPDDFSNTYVVTHWTNPGDPSSLLNRTMAENLVNSTQTLPAPTSQDKQAAYACSDTSCAQIDSKGDIYYIANALGTDFTVQSGATWSKMGVAVTGSPAPVANTTDSVSQTATSTQSGTSADTFTQVTEATATGSSSDKPSTPSATDKSAADTKSNSNSSSSPSNSGAGNGAASLNTGIVGLVLSAVAVAVASVL
jgi:hypothetical protein